MEEEETARAEAQNAERATKDPDVTTVFSKVPINETLVLLARNLEEGDGDKDSWGPKTAEMPDPTKADIEKPLDIGSLPEELKEKEGLGDAPP